MGVRLASSGTTTLLNTTSPSGADTAILTTGPIGLTQDNAQVQLFGFVSVLMGSTAVSIVVKIFRGSLASGTFINTGQLMTTIATNRVVVPICYIDTPGIVGQMQYTLSIQPGGGGTASVANDGCLLAMVL